MTVAVSITLKRYLRLRTTRRTAKLRQSWKRNVMTQRSKTRARRKKSRWLCWQIIFVEQETIVTGWGTHLSEGLRSLEYPCPLNNLMDTDTLWIRELAADGGGRIVPS